MATTIGDILINAKPYIVLSPNGYIISESPKSAPKTGGANARQFIRGDNWNYWGQSTWEGMGEEDEVGFLTEGTISFLDGYGLDLVTPGEINIAKQLASTQVDAANTDGWVPFTDGTTRLWYGGKTNGTALHTTDGSVWTSVANFLSATDKPRSWGLFKGKYFLSSSVGKLWELTAATTWTDRGTPGPTTEAFILGTYKGYLWVGYANALYKYDGTTFTQMFNTGNALIEGTPWIGVVGNSVLYFITKGPGSRVYMTDANQLHHVATFDSDFLPYRVKFVDTLYVVGGTTDDASTSGTFVRLEQNGFIKLLEYGDGTADFSIRDCIVSNNRIYWGANRKSGIGVFDPSMDIYEDTDMGFYIGSRTSTVGVVDAIAQFNGTFFCGILGSGIFKQTTPGPYKITSSLFHGETKNLNKLWGFSEIQHTSLVAGQTINIRTMKDGSTENLWGTSSTAGTTSKIQAGPVDYKSPYIQYVLDGDANGSALAILDISFAYIEVPDNPKREWDLVLVLEGSDEERQEMRDETLNTRTAAQMLSDLNALWNVRTTFEDIDGTTYTVIFKVPKAYMQDVIKETSVSGAIEDLAVYYRVHLTEL